MFLPRRDDGEGGSAEERGGDGWGRYPPTKALRAWLSVPRSASTQSGLGTSPVQLRELRLRGRSILLFAVTTVSARKIS